MLRHCVILEWSPESSEHDRDLAFGALRGLPDLVPCIEAFAIGLDLGISTGNGSIALTADFRDIEAYRHYAEHPEHLRILRDHVKPFIASRSAVQFSL